MENSIGLWEKKSQKGNIYYYGKTKINGKEYKISLFKVGEKKNEKQPDYNMLIKEVEEQKEEIKIEPSKKIEEKAEQVFIDFGNDNTIADEEIAF